MSDEVKRLVDRFLAWQLPKSVRPDPCVLDQPNYPHTLSGTNLLTAEEATQMFEHVLHGQQVPKKICEKCEELANRQLVFIKSDSTVEHAQQINAAIEGMKMFQKDAIMLRQQVHELQKENHELQYARREIESLRAQLQDLQGEMKIYQKSFQEKLQQKDADHKLIMESVERQRDLNDRQAAELAKLCDDHKAMREGLEFYSDKKNWDDRWVDGPTEESSGDQFDIISENDVEWPENECSIGGKSARTILANLKCKGE